MNFQILNNISSIADNYEGFLIDLWGVIHDGSNLYPGVLECLLELRKKNKQIIFLSNAPRRAFKAQIVLERLNIKKELYDHIVTSGEITYNYIEKFDHNLGTKFMILGPDKDDDILAGVPNHNQVTQIKDADFVVITGFDNDNSTLEELIPQISEIKKYNLPCICANPDIEVVKIDGTRALCAGVIAKYYEEIGGKVIYFGKPYKQVYEHSLKLFNSSSNKIAAIGDNLETDIKGANEFNLDSYLIAGGILAKELQLLNDEPLDKNKLMKLFAKYKITPKVVLPKFIW